MASDNSETGSKQAPQTVTEEGFPADPFTPHNKMQKHTPVASYQISRRDYFAGCALTGLAGKPWNKNDPNLADTMALASMQLADGLIKELDKND